MRIRQKSLLLGSTVALALCACSSIPSGPSVMALPGSGHNLNSFRADDLWCRNDALTLIGGRSAEASGRDAAIGSAAVGTLIGAAAGAALGGGHDGAAVGAGVGLLAGSAAGSDNARQSSYGSQRQYDNAYIQCMYAKGHRVPLPAETARSLSRSPTPVGNGYLQASPPPPPTSPPASATANPPAQRADSLGIPPPPVGQPPAPPPPASK